MRGKIGWIAAVLFCWAGVAGYAQNAELQEVRIGRVPYITVDSFCKKYSFNAPKQMDKDIYEIESPTGKRKLDLRIDSRECRYNNVLYWLSLPVIAKDDQILISKLDVSKLFWPLMNPQNVGPKMLVLGVILDPGHGGSNLGTVGKNGLTEKDANLAVARRVRDELRQEGIPCVMTRDSDKDISLEDRASFTKRYPAYLFVSIHHNEGGLDSRGVETFCLTPESATSTNDGGLIRVKNSQFSTGNYFDSANLLLASYIHREMVKLYSGDSDRGVKRARFAVLRRARAPSVLVEVGFMSNRDDLAMIKTPTFREKVAEKIGSAIKRFIAVMNQTDIPKEKLRRPTDRGLNFVSSPTTPRKAEFVKGDDSHVIKNDVKLASSDDAKAEVVKVDFSAVEENGKIDPREPEDGRGVKDSAPAEEIRSILNDKVQNILQEDKKTVQAEPSVQTEPDQPQAARPKRFYTAR